ncbi:MAG: type II secretion system F family protein [Actinomycetaceae bacterium]|nr:type II secretion system F family protein [Actinomycetaceae bacterium]
MSINVIAYGGVTLIGVMTAVVTMVVVLVRQRRRYRIREWFYGSVPDETGRKRPAAVNVAFVLAEVIARLRAGSAVRDAWEQTLISRGLPVGELGDDNVPETIRINSAFAGTSRAISAGCRITDSLGVPLADVLESILHSVEDARSARDARAVARAGPELTARLLTLLPLLGIGVAWFLGASVISVFTQNWLSMMVGAVGVGLWFGGHLWMRELVAKAASQADNHIDALVIVNLLRAAVQSGASIVKALSAIADATDDREFERVARALQLGASSEELESYVTDDDRMAIMRALATAWSVGASPIPMLEVAARVVREARNTRAREEAERLAIRMTLPLGLTLLPSFVCLGIFPVAVTFMSW